MVKLLTMIQGIELHKCKSMCV